MLPCLQFTTFGIAAVALTPNVKVAAVLSSNFYSLVNLFAGEQHAGLLACLLARSDFQPSTVSMPSLWRRLCGAQAASAWLVGVDELAEPDHVHA